MPAANRSADFLFHRPSRRCALCELRRLRPSALLLAGVLGAALCLNTAAPDAEAASGFLHWGAASAAENNVADQFAKPQLQVGTVLAAPEGPAAPGKPVVKLLVSPFAYPNMHFRIVEPTIAKLREVFGRNNFTAVVSSGNPNDLYEADLILSSTGTYLRMQNRGARDIASVVSTLAPDPNHAEGSLFITLKSRTDINTFEDMKGKRLVTTGPAAFSGYHVGLGEIAKRGEDPDAFFASRISSGYDMRLELEALRNNRADVGIVRTCFLEELKRSGEDVSDVKPLAVRSGADAPCLASTDLYPNWTMLATPKLSAEDTRKAALALLSMPRDADGLGWSIATNFRTADQMFRTIRRGPYEYLREWNWRHFWEIYWPWIMLGGFAVLGLMLHAWRTQRLVALRTGELREALLSQHKLERKAAQAQSRMEHLQRAGAVGQMSSIIAHELRQPLSTICGYAHGIERLLDQPGDVNRAMIAEGVSVMGEQAQQAEAIVEKVRSYAKGKGVRRTVVNAADLARRAVATINASRIWQTEVDVWTAAAELPVWGDSAEIELALQNLIKNALEACASEASPTVSVSVRKASSTESSAALERIVLAVDDNGPALTDDAFADLEGVLSSTKIDGLGLGLSIVRLIAEGHGGQLEFRRRTPSGLSVRIVLPAHSEAKGNKA